MIGAGEILMSEVITFKNSLFKNNIANDDSGGLSIV